MPLPNHPPTIKNEKSTLFKLIFAALLIILLMVCAYFVFNYFVMKKQLEEANQTLASRQINEKILLFTGFFIKEVLQAETEVDFETRLKLENAVRNIGDEKILAQWQKFTNSKTETEAQAEVKNLLEMLVSKIKL